MDTNVLVAALLRAREGASRAVLRHCLSGQCQPLIGDKLFLEYESLLARNDLFRGCPLNRRQRTEFLAGLAAKCEWIAVYYLWRPNLPDPNDNHVLELAVAGGAQAIVTHNVRDFRSSSIQFPGIAILTPAAFLPTLHFPWPR